MSVEVRWLASAATSCLHAADARLAGRKLVDAELSKAIDAPVTRLGEVITGGGIERQQLMRHALPLASGMDLTRQLAEVTLRKTLGGERGAVLVEDLTECFGELRSAYHGVRGGVVDELEVRSKPLREQWEARGAGLLSALSRATEDGLVVEQADVVLVDPVTGGGGGAHLLYNSVRIEAVLTNPVDALPETVRLAWLVGQLNLDCPVNQGMMPPAQASRCGALALVPATLFAAETVELARLDRTTVELALAQWIDGDTPAAATLMDWWGVYESSRPNWPVAIAALDQMLGDSNEAAE